jgi:hypothetical protein
MTCLKPPRSPGKAEIDLLMYVQARPVVKNASYRKWLSLKAMDRLQSGLSLAFEQL